MDRKPRQVHALHNHRSGVIAMIWFFIWAGLKVMALGALLALNGQERKTKYSFWGRVVSSAIDVWIMWMWGAFDTLFGANS
jgi:hypothetical protein